MTEMISILWPKGRAPKIEEVAFSYKFCQRVSQEQCKGLSFGWEWEDYSGDQTLDQVLSQTRGEYLLLVTDPEIVLSATAIMCLSKVLSKGFSACGPVYNQSPFGSQVAGLPAPYVNVPTYLETAEILSESKGQDSIVVDALDPACVLFRRGFVKHLDRKGLCSRIDVALEKAISGDLGVALGSLVHSFGKYYDHERDDLVGLVPETVKRVMDIGCAKGGYGRRLKQIRPDIFLAGVEINPIMAESAKPFYDEVIIDRIENVAVSHKFELVNCGDILEHLQDPWDMLKRLNGLLKKGGYLVTSIPNGGHWSIVRDLLKGRFQYVPVGLLCVSHIRWFTEVSIRQMLGDAGFSVELFQREQMSPTPLGEAFIRDMCAKGYGDEESLRTNEFFIRAQKK